jgi:hypothetical protein
MDLFGPCITLDMGNKYTLTVTDAFTKYAEIFAIPIKEPETVAEVTSNHTHFTCTSSMQFTSGCVQQKIG